MARPRQPLCRVWDECGGPVAPPAGPRTRRAALFRLRFKLVEPADPGAGPRGNLESAGGGESW